MRSSPGSPIFSDFKSDLSRVARFPTAGQGERRPWVRGCGVVLCDPCSLNKGYEARHISLNVFVMALTVHKPQ